MNRWLFLAGAILFEVTASLSLKGALTHPALYVVVGIGYVASFVCLAATLRAGMALGVAYGIWGATGVALTAALSTALFGEPFTPLMGLGIALIIGGVLLVELGSQSAHRRATAAASSASSGSAREGGRE
ncbi:DMT family transporter [Leifsonia aquatica]|uniref:DMT family transporter n=1 Tax=Leifsonia aquatica TaxID=144185 RepID=UPI00046945A5|nr:multidrug efflux SMR transporter [Leifsonia aquatica]